MVITREKKRHNRVQTLVDVWEAACHSWKKGMSGAVMEAIVQ